LAGRVDGVVAAVQQGEGYLVGPGLSVFIDSGRDGAGTSPGHQLIDEFVAETGNVAGGESHTAEAGLVARDAGQEPQRTAGGFSGPVGVRPQDGHLADDERCLRSQDAPRGAGVVGSDQQQDRARGSVTGELKLTGAERGQDPAAGRHRRFALVELVQVLVQWAQRPGNLGAAQPGDEAARRAGLQIGVELDHFGGRVDVHRDDARDDRYRRGRLYDLRDAAQVVDLPAAQPDRGVPESLQRGRLGEMSPVGGDLHRHSDGPKIKLVHRVPVRCIGPPEHDART
jgi:hypothetical protein